MSSRAKIMIELTLSRKETLEPSCFNEKNDVIVDGIDSSMPSTSGRREPMNSSIQDEELLEESDVDISEPYEDSSEDYVPTKSEFE
ncbi:hypothetical protein HHI36_000986 [Cryptolaemus montrouzieri]|uniref:Uncharacterized protein n=1 Tax=Cryptolaemus montrouzieri TaxID=559131 RepID=A0ABD2P6L1_9CUCU